MAVGAQKAVRAVRSVRAVQKTQAAHRDAAAASAPRAAIDACKGRIIVERGFFVARAIRHYAIIG
jgi:hypothetical protein